MCLNLRPMKGVFKTNIQSGLKLIHVHVLVTKIAECHTDGKNFK